MASNSSISSTGPTSLEPAIEKDGVRVALRTAIQKKNILKVLIRISNLSENPILVSPDAVEAFTEEGFVIPTVQSKPTPTKRWGDSSSSHNAWSKFSTVAALIPFSDPYRIISSGKAIASYVEKKQGQFFQTSKQKNTFREVILQPGMATHGIMTYDASSLRAFDYAPNLHIKVMVGSEPFEFQFSSRPVSSNPPPQN